MTGVESCGPAWVMAGSGPRRSTLPCHAPTTPHPTPLPEGEREEAPADKPVKGRSSQEKKGLPPPPVPPFFPPPKGAEKTEDAQEGHRGAVIPAGMFGYLARAKRICHSRRSPLSFPPVLAGIHRQRGAGGAEATRKRSEAVGIGTRLAPSPLPGEGRGEGRKWPVARVAPPMRGNDFGIVFILQQELGGSPHAWE